MNKENIIKSKDILSNYQYEELWSTATMLYINNFKDTKIDSVELWDYLCCKFFSYDTNYSELETKELENLINKAYDYTWKHYMKQLYPNGSVKLKETWILDEHGKKHSIYKKYFNKGE